MFGCFIFVFHYTFSTIYCTFLVKINKHAVFFIVLSQKSHYYVYSYFLHLRNVTFKWKINFENMMENNSCCNENLKDIKIHYLLSHYINIIFHTLLTYRSIPCCVGNSLQTVSTQVQPSVKRDFLNVSIVFIQDPLKD